MVYGLVVAGIVSAFLALALGVMEPGPPEDRTRVFGQGDLARLDRDFPGGYLLNDQVWVFCYPAGNDARFGRVVWVHADLRTTWWSAHCWMAQRERSVSW